ncbi:unnamed protein product [Parnassius mnemosyne]|uniref:Uncharacterized protein n=1 Tax=Parnassius mnemosyne TaxID=213953 RepID=A0AAV1KLV7_9NEOP
MATAQTDSELKKYFLQKSIECSNENPVNVDEIDMLKKHTVPKSKNAKCLLACIFRKTTWMDEKGMFVMENAIKVTKEKHPKDWTEMENSKKLFELCKKGSLRSSYY